MKLKRIEIKNLRRIEYANINFSPASFLIGSNNIGKTTVIKAIEALLSLSTVIKPDDFRILASGEKVSEMEICGYFSDIDNDTANSRGFKGRVVKGEYFYKKVFSINASKPKIFTKQHNYKLSEKFKSVDKWQDLLDIGYKQEELEKLFEKNKQKKDKLDKDWHFKIDGAIDWDFDSEAQEVENPGGIPSVVLSKLPKLMHIPSYANVDDIGKADNNKTLLGECLGILFDDLLSNSKLATTIQDNLSCLQKEMSSTKEGSMINNLCTNVNRIINDVFPECGIDINPSLEEVSSVLKPKYSVGMYSNVSTNANRQGTGLVRTGIFSMLRYHSTLKSQGDTKIRPLIVAFEEPEIYLHPSAANLLRDTIYALGKSDQIVCTTHSPWMIDLSEDWQSLTKLYLNSDGYTSAVNYGLSEATNKLKEDEKLQLKMIKTFDDELSRVFFAQKCIIVEGDSEVVVIKNTLKLLPEEVRKEILSKYQIVKARGKAAIISLVKYLKVLGVEFYVIHDRDAGTEGAEKFNKPIEDAVGNSEKISMLEECLEDCIGYKVPSSDKPYKAYQVTSEWRNWNEIPKNWRDVFIKAFHIDNKSL